MKTTEEDPTACTHTQPHTVQHIFHASSCLQQLATATPWLSLVIQNLKVRSTPAGTQRSFHQKGAAHRGNMGTGYVLFTCAYIPALELGH